MATVQYDDILLNIGSRADSSGIKASIDLLKELKSVFPIDGLGDSATQMKAFADALNSMDKNVVTALSKVKGSLGKVASVAQKANKSLEPPTNMNQAWREMLEDRDDLMDKWSENIPTEPVSPFSKDITDAVQREMERLRSMREGGNYTPPEAYTDPAKIAQENAEAAKALEQINKSVSDGADEAQRFDENVKQLVADLRNAPPTTNSFLKQQGYTTQEIVAAKQEIANMKWEEKQAALEAKEVAKEVGKIGKEAEKAKSPIEKFAERFKNLIMYRLLRSVITGIGNAIKGGITNLEQWSRKTGMSDFYKSIDTARESWEVLKNSFAVVIAPGLEWLIGIFEKIARLVMAAANAVSRFFAILGGKSTYTAVEWADYSAKATDDYGQSIGKATDEAKEFKRQLMGFDEINNLTAQGDGGSGGGGGGASGGGFNFTDMFEEKETGAATEFESKLQTIITRFKELLGQLAPVKTALAGIKTTVKQVTTSFKNLFGKVKVWMSRIDWTGIWEKLKQVIFAAVDAFVGFVSFLGTVISVGLELFGVVGDVVDVFGGWNAIGMALKVTLTKLQIVFDAIHIGLIGLEAIVKSVGAVFEFLGTVASEFFKALSGKQSWNDFKRNCAEATNNMKEKISDAAETAKSKVAEIFKKRYSMGFTLTVKLKEVDISGLGPATMTYESYANGGYPNTGSLFIAGEAGPEMVGTIGGSTAVVNNDQIVAAVSQGVAQAVASVLGGGTNVNVVLEGDANKLFRVVQSQARNYAIQTGSYAFG